MKTLVRVLMVSLASASWLFPQGPRREPKEGMYDSCRDLEGPKPLLQLPAEVPAKAGELTCHADFANAADGWIRIYLVNRREGPTGIGLTNGDPNFKAYRELPDGRWERVQPAGSWVMCGDSIRVLTIHPGMFVTFHAKYRPPGETACRIRYQVPGQDDYVSNSGQGSWDEKERDEAQLDGNCFDQLPFWIRTMEDFRVDAEGKDLRGRERIEEEIVYLDLLLHYRDFRAPRLWSEQLLMESEEYPEEWRGLAKDRIKHLLDRTPVASRTPAEFVSFCLDALEVKSKDHPPVFGDLTAYPQIIWAAVAHVSARGKQSDGFPWKRVFEVIVSRFPQAGPLELEGMWRVMKNERQVHENVSSEFLIGGMKSKHANFRAECVRLLMHRGMADEVTAEASKSDSEGRFAVAKVLVSPESLGARYGSVSDYLVARVNENPERALEVIYEGSGYKTDIHLSPELWLALRPWMERAVSVGLEGPVEMKTYQERERVLRVLRIGFRDRTPFLRKLLASEAYHEQTRSVTDGKGTASKTERIRFLADEARRMLARSGVVP